MVPYEWGEAAADLARSQGLEDVSLTSFAEGITHLGGLSREPLQVQAAELIAEMMRSS